MLYYTGSTGSGATVVPLHRVVHSMGGRSSSEAKAFMNSNLFFQVSPVLSSRMGLMQVASPQFWQTRPARSLGSPGFPVDQYSRPPKNLAPHLGQALVRLSSELMVVSVVVDDLDTGLS